MIFSNLGAKKHQISNSMITNHECKNKQLSDTLSVFFEKNVNLTHIKLISLFMMALCKARTVCFSKLPKRGTSNTQERIDLVQRYINLFGADSIDCLLADREFVGERWITLSELKSCC